MAIRKISFNHCPRCNCFTTFELVMRYNDKETIPYYKCPGCNVEVPVQSFDYFLETGQSTQCVDLKKEIFSHENR